MSSHTLSDAITKMDWIDRVAKPVQNGLASLYKSMGSTGRDVEDFLHGKWLGHPLHPALVHLPLGAFVLSAITDLFAFNPAARATSTVAILVGLLGMFPALVTGLTDWYPYGDDSVRRIGGLHMLLNVLGLLLYLVSDIFRWNALLGAGILFGYLGFFSIGFSGYLGGILVFNKRAGTDHSPQPEDSAAPEEYVPVIAEADLLEDLPKKAQVGDTAIVLIRSNERIIAMANACAHEGGPLSEGTLENGCLVCPWHQSAFRLENGTVALGPSVYDQPYFPTRIRNGFIEVCVVRLLEPMLPGEPRPVDLVS